MSRTSECTCCTDQVRPLVKFKAKLIAPRQKDPIESTSTVKARAKGTYTITFGDVAENGTGMQKLGNMAVRGISMDELRVAETLFLKQGFTTELIDIAKAITDEDLDYLRGDGKPAKIKKTSKLPLTMDNVEAGILIVRNGADALLGEGGADQLLLEQQHINYDTRKIGMYGKEVNSIARHNVCFDQYDQDMDLDNKKGTVINFKRLPQLNSVKEGLTTYIPYLKEIELRAEGNHYYNTRSCGIGWHGDKERKVVIAVRLGESMNLHYSWYYACQRVGTQVKLMLNHGDIYFMSDKAVGYDTGSPTKLTLRHCAGADKYTT